MGLNVKLIKDAARIQQPHHAYKKQERGNAGGEEGDREANK